MGGGRIRVGRVGTFPHHFQNGLSALKSARAGAAPLVSFAVCASSCPDTKPATKARPRSSLGLASYCPSNIPRLSFSCTAISLRAPRQFWIRFAAFRNAIRRLVDFLFGKTSATNSVAYGIFSPRSAACGTGRHRADRKLWLSSRSSCATGPVARRHGSRSAVHEVHARLGRRHRSTLPPRSRRQARSEDRDSGPIQL